MEEINLKEVYNYFLSKIVMILIIVGVVLVAGNIYSLAIRTPMYHSSTTVVLVSEKKDTYSTTDLQLNQNLVGTYSQIIKSRKVLSKVIDNLKLKCTVEELMENITVSSVDSTEIIKITVSDAKAMNAFKITDEVANVFTDEIKDIYNLENISIVDKAVIATAPYNANLIKDNLIYLLAGIVLSCGVVFVIYYFDTTIKSSETVEEKLGLTVLGVVPDESKE